MQQKVEMINSLAQSLANYIAEHQPDMNNWARLNALSKVKEAVMWGVNAVAEGEAKPK